MYIHTYTTIISVLMMVRLRWDSLRIVQAVSLRRGSGAVLFVTTQNNNKKKKNDNNDNNMNNDSNNNNDSNAITLI